MYKALLGRRLYHPTHHDDHERCPSCGLAGSDANQSGELLVRKRP